MNIDTGLAAVIVAVLIFYLRLIVIQREAARRARQAVAKATKKGSKASAKKPQPAPNYSIMSKNRVDLAIAGTGLLAVVVGALAYGGLIGLAGLQTYWWAPTSLGIIAFSWAFKLPK